jgi:hypothetical protein
MKRAVPSSQQEKSCAFFTPRKELCLLYTKKSPVPSLQQEKSCAFTKE